MYMVCSVVVSVQKSKYVETHAVVWVWWEQHTQKKLPGDDIGQKAMVGI